MTLNRPLLTRALQFVQASERESLQPTVSAEVWRQEDWARLQRESFTPEEAKALNDAELLETCGTAYCVAGFVTSKLPGYSAEIELSEPNSISGRVYATLYEYLDGESLSDDESDEYSHYQQARLALGLSRYQADLLFDGDNSVEDIEDLINRFFAQEDRDLAEATQG